MTEKAEIEKDWDENFGKAWVNLLEGTATIHARMCFVAMTSFGPGICRAGMKAIGKRMGVKSKNTVRAAQRELIALGWMTQTRMETKTEPARYRMHQFQQEGHNMTLGGSKDALGEGHGVTPKQELKQELNKKEIATAVRGNPIQAELKALIEVWERLWCPEMNQNYLATKKDEQIFKGWLKAGVKPEQLEAKVKAFLAVSQDYHQKKRYPLWLLEKTWNELSVDAAPRPKDCRHPWESFKVEKDYGLSAQGQCGACGKKVTIKKPKED